MTNECVLLAQSCCRNAMRDARLTVHLTQLQVFLVLQFGPPSVSDVLLVSLNSLNPISSARSFKMPAANRECPSSAQCKLPARGRRATTPTLAIQASHLPFNSSDTYHAPHTSRRHDPYNLQTIDDLEILNRRGSLSKGGHASEREASSIHESWFLP